MDGRGEESTEHFSLFGISYAEVGRRGGSKVCRYFLSERTEGATYRAADQEAGGIDDAPASRIAWPQRRASIVWAKLTSPQASETLLQVCCDDRSQHAEGPSPPSSSSSWDVGLFSLCC